MTNIKATYFSEVDMAGKLKCVPLWFIGIDIEWKSWQNSPNSKSKPMIDIDNFDSIPIYNSKPTFIAWHCQSLTNTMPMQAFFSAFGQKLDYPKYPKTWFFTQKLDFRKQKLDFPVNISTIWPFLHPKISMNHKIGPKELISDLKTAKKAKTRLSNVKSWFKMLKKSMWKAKNSILKPYGITCPCRQRGS